MPSPIDDLFAQITRISTAIQDLPDGDPERRRLELERDRMRLEATKLADAGRHPESVRLEMLAIEARLDEIERMKITAGYQERRGGKNLQDPGAYSATINRMLEAQYEDEVAELTRRLERLRSFTDESEDP
jgi:hypothetical protein